MGQAGESGWLLVEVSSIEWYMGQGIYKLFQIFVSN